jgi:hypothetical protein
LAVVDIDFPRGHREHGVAVIARVERLDHGSVAGVHRDRELVRLRLRQHCVSGHD